MQPAQAQVVGDQTLDSQVDRVDNDHLVITGGQEAGQNLFHSFSEFSVPSDFTVHFNNDVDIANIFSRVTGGSISDINGLIRANGDASLFLLNPAGIIFGPNAQLDIGGSFIATTAEAIRFSDGIEFSAANTETEALLTVNIPVGLQYGKSPGAIISNGIVVNEGTDEEFFPKLSINPGKTIALIGGEVLLKSSTLEAEAARTEIGSVSDREFVTLQPEGNGWIVNYDNVNEFGKVTLSDRSRIISGNGGSIQIRGKEILVRNSLIDNVISEEVLAGNIRLIATDLIEIDDSFIFTQVGAEQGSNVTSPITSKGGNILLEGNRINVFNASFIFSGTSTDTDGDSGNITIRTENLLVQDGGQILAASFGRGAAGTITVNATESIKISGTAILPLIDPDTREEIGEQVVESAFLANTQSGTGGEINLTANSIVLQDDGTISAFTSGNGAGGEIVVNTGNLLIQDGGQITADSFGEGAAGKITVNATESIEISGTGVVPNLLGELESGFFATTQSGTGGEIELTANSILLRDNGTISALAENNGDGGNIDIATDTLVLFDPSEIRADAEEGRGGNIQINTQGLFVASGVEDQINASSERGIDGEVDINILDVDTKIDTTLPERSPLVVENLIYTGCSFGKESINNQFNYIGRGGLPLNPMEEITTEDVMVDLGKIELPKTQNQTPESTVPFQYEPDRGIREANSFLVDKDGNVKLVAQASTVEFPSTCQFNGLRP